MAFALSTTVLWTSSPSSYHSRRRPFILEFHLFSSFFPSYWRPSLLVFRPSTLFKFCPPPHFHVNIHLCLGISRVTHQTQSPLAPLSSTYAQYSPSTHLPATQIAIDVQLGHFFGIYLGPTGTPTVVCHPRSSRSSPQRPPWVIVVPHVGFLTPSYSSTVPASVFVVHQPSLWSAVTVRLCRLSNFRRRPQSPLVSVHRLHVTR